MATTWITYETGTLGATVAAPDSVQNFGTGSLVYDGTHVLNGTKSLKIVPSASSACYCRAAAGINSAQLAVTVGFWFDTTSTADEDILRIEDSTGGRLIGVTRAGSGKLSLTDKTGTAPRLWIGTSNPVTGQWIIAKLWIQVNATTSAAGQVKFGLYNSDGTALATTSGGISGGLFTSSASTLGTVNADRVLVGRTGSQVNTDTRWYDTVGYDPAATDLLANYVADRAPVANAGPDQTVNPGATVTLDGTGSTDPDADTLTYAWTQTAGPTVALSSSTASRPTFTAPSSTSSQTATFQLTVSDGTLTSSDTISVTISPYVVGTYTSASTVWTTYEGGTVGAAMVNGTDGEAFVAATGTSYVYDSAHAFVGSRSMKITPGSAAQASVRHKSGLNTTKLAVSVPVWYDNLATVEEDILRIHDIGGAKIVAVSRHGTGKLTITDQNGSTPRLWLATGTLPTAQWIQLKLWIQIGGTATTGTVKLGAFDAAGNLLFGIYTQAANLGTVNADAVWLGRIGTQGSTDARWYDTVGYDPTATDNLRNFTTNQVPTANAGPDQTVNPGDTVTLSGSGTDPEGATLTYLWTPPSGITLSSNTVAQPTFTAPVDSSPQTLTFLMTVNDGASNSPADSVTINVNAYVPSGYTSASTVWITYDGGSNGAAMINGTDGEAFVPATGTSYVYDKTHVHAGAEALKIIPGSAAQAAVRVKSGMNTNQLAVTVPVWYDNLATVEEDIFRILDTAGAKVVTLTRHGTGKLEILDLSGTNPRLWQSNGTPPTGEWLILKLFVQLGSTATTGQLTFLGYDSTNQLLFSFKTQAANLGAVNFGQFWLGRVGTQGSTDARWYDTVGYDPTATDVLANYNIAPSAGPDLTSVEPYTTVNLTGTSYDGQDLTWTQLSGSPTVNLIQSGNNASFIAPTSRTSTVLTFRASNGTLSDSCTVTVLCWNEWINDAGTLRPVRIRTAIVA